MARNTFLLTFGISRTEEETKESTPEGRTVHRLKKNGAPKP
ncbi:hypothetical protein M065_0095 [Bacteroides fragilis str. Korea 419]|nr:hypothetical protein M065_0095 [Bacteroides fragilis str. Korea 419]